MSLLVQQRTVADLSAAKLPVAIRYDGATKDYPLASNGQYLAVHPVDQRVALKMIVRFGSMKSVPTLGSRFHLIPLDTRADASARSEVLRVLGDEVAAGNIQILSITTDIGRQTTGRLVVQVLYINLRLVDPTARRTVSNVSPLPTGP